MHAVTRITAALFMVGLAAARAQGAQEGGGQAPKATAGGKGSTGHADPGGGKGAAAPRRIESTEVKDNYFVAGDCQIGGQPTERGFRDAKAKGVKTVVNLRRASEQKDVDEKAMVEGLGLRYVAIAVHLQGPDRLNDSAVDPFLVAMKDAPKPVLIHCATGNRASALWAVHLAVNAKVPVDEALARARQTGLHPEVEGWVREMIASRVGRPTGKPPAAAGPAAGPAAPKAAPAPKPPKP